MLVVDVLTESVHTNLSTPWMWLFLEINGEPQEFYFRRCTASVADQKLTEGTYATYFFDL